MIEESIKSLKEEALNELEGNILPFWATRMIDGRGGFIGRISGTDEPCPDACKGIILNARILWTFSATYHILGQESYRRLAERARNEIIGKFYDKEHGGVFWNLYPDGRIESGKKQIYAIAFAIYGLSEYYWATADTEALTYAVKLYEDIENHAYDTAEGGYFEAFARDWSEIVDVRLSEKDRNEKKTMNTHLHILEAYTNLYRAWPDKVLESRIRNLLKIFAAKIFDRTSGHLGLFFDTSWECRSTAHSYGHDIEASWLLDEACEVLGDRDLAEETARMTDRLAEAALEGLHPDGGLMNERDYVSGKTDMARDWWVQAECVVGCLKKWQAGGLDVFLETALSVWEFIKGQIIDREQGEWLWGVDGYGKPDRSNDKAGFWKCPYHNSRACLEIMRDRQHRC